MAAGKAQAKRLARPAAEGLSMRPARRTARSRERARRQAFQSDGRED